MFFVVVFFLAWTAETHSTIKVLLILYFASDPGSEPESESIRSAEPESESEQPHHDSAPLIGIEPLHFSSVELLLICAPDCLVSSPVICLSVSSTSFVLYACPLICPTTFLCHPPHLSSLSCIRFAHISSSALRTAHIVPLLSQALYHFRRSCLLHRRQLRTSTGDDTCLADRAGLRSSGHGAHCIGKKLTRTQYPELR